MAKAKTSSPNKLTNKQVITMPEATSIQQAKKNPPSAVPALSDLESKIRERAYELYLERGNTASQENHENEDWLRAEREVLARESQQRTA
jgi:Protein of unknown function (DUF2934)